MQYVIWAVSIIGGLVLAIGGFEVGWLILVGGTLAGFIVSRKKTEDRQARKIARAMKDE